MISNSLRSPICTPLVSENIYELIDHAKILMKYNPDLIEWRVDKLNNINMDSVLESLFKLNKLITGASLLFTLRNHNEGGYNEVNIKSKKKILSKVIKTGLVDIVDYEMNMINKKSFDIKEMCINNKTKLLLSHHNFENTPTAKTIYQKLLEGQEKEADIVKVVVMANDYDDVNTIFQVANQIDNEKFNTPYILIAMGEKGIITRVLSGLIGSSFTFAEACNSSALGQLFIEDLRSIWDKLQFSNESNRIYNNVI